MRVRTIGIHLRDTLLERLSGFEAAKLILIPRPPVPYRTSAVSGEDVDHTFKQCTGIYEVSAHPIEKQSRGPPLTRVVVDGDQES